MFLRSALSAALLAVPLAGLAGQSAPEQHPRAGSPGDSSDSHHVAWVAGAGAAVGAAALFTSIARLREWSQWSASANAERGFVLPSAPTPNRYTDGTLFGTGASAGQNQPPTAPPNNPTTPPTDSTSAGGGNQTSFQDPPSQDQPPPGFPTQEFTTQPLTVVVVTPEPDAVALVATGLVALLPMARRRRTPRRR